MRYLKYDTRCNEIPTIVVFRETKLTKKTLSYVCKFHIFFLLIIYFQVKRNTMYNFIIIGSFKVCKNITVCHRILCLYSVVSVVFIFYSELASTFYEGFFLRVELCLVLGKHSSIIVPPSWIVKLPRKGSFKSSLRKSPKKKLSSKKKNKEKVSVSRIRYKFILFIRHS